MPQDYKFTLIYKNAEVTEEMRVRLRAAGCQDASLLCKDEYLHIQFNRFAASFDQAVCTAANAVIQSGIGLVLVGAHPFAAVQTLSRKARHYHSPS